MTVHPPPPPTPAPYPPSLRSPLLVGLPQSTARSSTRPSPPVSAQVPVQWRPRVLTFAFRHLDWSSDSGSECGLGSEGLRPRQTAGYRHPLLRENPASENLK